MVKGKRREKRFACSTHQNVQGGRGNFSSVSVENLVGVKMGIFVESERGRSA